MSKSTRLILVASAGVMASAVSVQGNEYQVVDGIVQATEDETVAIAADLAPHGFTLQSQEVEAPAPVELIAKHRGGGSWSVLRGEEELLEGLKKPEAEAFNALSVEDREAALEYALATAQPEA